MRKYDFEPQFYKNEILNIVTEIGDSESWNDRAFRNILRKYPKDGKNFFSRDQVISGYKFLLQENLFDTNKIVEERIRMKPTRTISGVAPVTVLTKPFPCPGKCIFCPNDVRMPKSYLRDEPGAQRAEMNRFDPYLQTYNRLLAFQKTGHNVEKVELIILGGTWSFYPESYQIWFVKRCFDAMNDFGIRDERINIQNKTINHQTELIKKSTKDDNSDLINYNLAISKILKGENEDLVKENEKATWEELETQQKINETAKSKCVGLVIETRPDYIDEKEIIKIRRLGATKVQIGIQSMDDEILEINKRGHTVEQTKKAIKLLRTAGFKIHCHWMPNLYGSTVEKDIQDYTKIWESEIRPDELKIYPTSIIGNTELYEEYKKGNYQPYNYEELLEVLTNTIPTTPRYCRLTRIIRDIPSTDIIAGNKLSNFRQIAENEIEKNGKKCECIRCREIKNKEVKWENLELEIIEYETSVGKEKFISYRTKDEDKIVGFLRLSLPENKEENFIEELKNKAIIREVHVYGQVVGIGKEESGKSQHIGLGTKLIEKACEIAKQNGFAEISVISAIGTREYYKKKGFNLDNLYMSKKL